MATNWTKDRLEGVEASERCAGHHDGPSVEQFTAKSERGHPERLDKCESLGPTQYMILHGNPIGTCKELSSANGSPSTSFFCQICTSGAVCCFRAPSEVILTSFCGQR